MNVQYEILHELQKMNRQQRRRRWSRGGAGLLILGFWFALFLVGGVAGRALLAALLQ